MSPEESRQELSAEEIEKMLQHRREVLNAMALDNLKKRLRKRLKKGDSPELKEYVKNFGQKKTELPPRYITKGAK